MGDARAVFAFADLSGLNLSGRNLADADTEETDLTGAKLPAMFVESAAAAP
jgi:uncharacterized protein YjbI with pentapeptide repeats